MLLTVKYAVVRLAMIFAVDSPVVRAGGRAVPLTGGRLLLRGHGGLHCTEVAE